VLYEAFTLALALQSIEEATWGSSLHYNLRVGRFDPSEVLHSAALVKIRLLYDFLYNSDSTDDITLQDFSQYGFSNPLIIPQELVGCEGQGEFKKNSINKFIAHLTKARITKPECTPQPSKFEQGRSVTVTNAKAVLRDVDRFVRQVINHPDFSGLDNWGESYLDGFRAVMSRIDAVPNAATPR
jgi:hypothetical protein